MDNLRKFLEVISILEQHNFNDKNLIPILQEVQKEYRYLPEEVMVFIATSLNIPPARVFGVASFYSHFTLKPKGKYVVKICDGTACHVKGSSQILSALRNHLELPEGEITTKDMLFTIEAVSCLGTCGLAPAIVINEDVYGLLTEEKAINIISEIIEREGI
jgi:NADH-quinone oxidoreductase subunit E